MKHLLMFSIMISLCCFLSSCGKKIVQSDGVIIVTEDNIAVGGKVIVTRPILGGPSTWLPEAGNIIIFRVDKTIGYLSGKAGSVYMLHEDNKLENIGQADSSTTDKELFARYLRNGKKDRSRGQ
jgi:hypothetical protein